MKIPSGIDLDLPCTSKSKLQISPAFSNLVQDQPQEMHYYLWTSLKQLTAPKHTEFFDYITFNGILARNVAQFIHVNVATAVCCCKTIHILINYAHNYGSAVSILDQFSYLNTFAQY